MAPKERITAGVLFFAYAHRPKISTNGSVTGSMKDVVEMHWMDADDFAVRIDRDGDKHDMTLSPFVCVSVHEHHIIAW